MKATNAHNPRYTGREPMLRPTPCDWPDCREHGRYRAPRTRTDLRDYFMFCLDHVRAYNARWNFFAGMSGPEIEAFRHADLTGHRPTWRLGERHAPFTARPRAADGFGLFGGHGTRAPRVEPAIDPEERGALDVLGLDGPVGIEALKARFKQLVKRHHPDANAGDRRSEERLRLVIQAYRMLLARWRG